MLYYIMYYKMHYACVYKNSYKLFTIIISMISGWYLQTSYDHLMINLMVGLSCERLIQSVLTNLRCGNPFEMM
jgi:hypothetical protein